MLTQWNRESRLYNHFKLQLSLQFVDAYTIEFLGADHEEIQNSMLAQPMR